MIIIKSFCASVIAVSACFALSISGRVTDTGGTPITGAAVRLEIDGHSAVSGVDGKFTLGTEAGIKDRSSPLKLDKSSVRINNGFLLMDLKEKVSVEVITCDLQGRTISTIRAAMDIGLNSLPLPFCGSGVFLYKVLSGNTEFWLKSNSLSSYSQAKTGSIQCCSSNKSFVKRVKASSVFNDVIAVTKDGYLNYRSVMCNSDTTGIEIKMIVCSDTVRDADGNLYHAVRIGNQVWTVENLRTTKNNDGSLIPFVTDTNLWPTLSTPGYCYYNNTSNADSITKFGALYNWHAVIGEQFSPAGWHVPSGSDWNTLQIFLSTNGYNWIDTLSGNLISKSLAARTDWHTCSDIGTIGNNLGANNKSGFSALPGGYHFGYTDNFSLIGSWGGWWSTTAFDARNAYYFVLYSNDVRPFILDYYKVCGLSVRLLRD